jgi:hypothetical protein
MTISATQSLAARINAADPNTLADALRSIGFGTMLRQQRQTLRRQSPNTAPVSPYDIATVQTLFLPDDCKAVTLGRAYARAGTGTKGEMTATAYASPFVAPAAGAYAITPAGNLAFLIADAYTDVDVDYEAAAQDIVEFAALNCIAATGICALPASVLGVLGSGVSAGVTMMMEAEVLVGTVVGKKIILVPATAAPATGFAQLDLPKANVRFAVADGATSVRVKLGVCLGSAPGGAPANGQDFTSLLGAASPIL